MASNSPTSTQILEEFGRVRRLLNKIAIQSLTDLKIGVKQMGVLRLVHRQGQCSLTEIAEGIGSDMAATSRMINSLVESSWLKKAVDPVDRRQCIVKLNAKALKKVDEIESVYKEVSNRFTKGLTKGEQYQFYTLLTKIEQHMRSESEMQSHG